MDEEKVEKLREWLGSQLPGETEGKTVRDRLRECQPSLLSQAILKITDAIAPKKS